VTSPRPNPDFRPNPERGIFLTGVIGSDTLDRLTPSILKLQAQSRSPISLYIDSLGGNTFHAETLQGLLQARQQDQPSIRLITVATATAASAAADLLISGDYALAYPHSIIHCHGIRMGQDEITHEGAVDIARYLSGRNESFALRHAFRCISRFCFRYFRIRTDFPDIRANDANLTDVACFVRALQSRLAPNLQGLLDDALHLSAESDELADYLATKHSSKSVKTRAQFEAQLFKGIIDFELRRNKREATWSFLDLGFERIEEKFKLLIDARVGAHHTRMISRLCYQWKDFFLSDEQTEELEKTEEAKQEEWLNQKIGEKLRPIWFLLVSIGRLLQKGEFRLSAEDAYWLGLIDEVIGREDLHSLRQIVEYTDAPEPTEKLESKG
jgi:ATP-dependent protease ClpP protease subunit